MAVGKPLGAGPVLAWASVALGFGLIQGVIYLRSFWGRFGLDPFQFGNASDLAIVGLTGIGVTIAFMMGAALLGGYLCKRIEEVRPLNGWILGSAVLVSLGGLAALAFFVDFGIYLLIGVVLTWAIIWLVRRSPTIPESIKELDLLAYVALAIAYMPMATHYYGQRKADQILGSDKALMVDSERSAGEGLPQGNQRFVGRLGNEYILYGVDTRSVSIVQADAVKTISLKRQKQSR